MQYELPPESSFADKALLKSENCEKFFLILNQLRKNATQHLDLVELAYIVICLGYPGNYRLPAMKQIDIEHLLDNLYQIIREQRGDKLPPLLVKNFPEKKRRTGHRSIKPWRIIGIALALVFCVFVTCGYLLNSKSKFIMTQLTTVPPTHSSQVLVD